RRAREIERLLERTRFCVDLHQTIEPCGTPFFIFAYDEHHLRFAQSIATDLPVVTYRGNQFSTLNTGLTLYEFVARIGGVGIGVELGQKGFGFYSEAVGLKVALGAIATMKALAAGNDLPELSGTANPLYPWQAVVPYPEGNVALDDGLFNFQAITRGQRLGMDGDQPIVAPASGALLFPKYVRSPDEPRPPELYRLMRRVYLADLAAPVEGAGSPVRPQAPFDGERHAR
ncbi:MAG TPA: succinylglutamate desuccinylase/aspartoacylase family protein, partial [Arenibaculum sp.]|nr:succinylglutamate desuccinylase/aspartoacylase family protein [Arenibaculum sp.]